MTEIDLKAALSLEVRERASRALAVRSFSVTLDSSPHREPPYHYRGKTAVAAALR